MQKKKVAIIDDHPTVRLGLAMRLSLEPDLIVCGEAENVDDGLQLIRGKIPHIAVVDISLKTGSGLDLIKAAKSENECTKYLVWSMYEESIYADRALRAGAMGYINKQAATDRIVEAIRTVLDGGVYLSSEMSSTLLHRVVVGQAGIRSSPQDVLSDRELYVFEQIGRGKTTHEIADSLQLSPSTVETYRGRVKQKLDLNSIPELTRYATEWVLDHF